MLANLTSFDESERADYLVALAAMAAADGEISSEELLLLRDLCERLALGPTARGRVITATTAGEEIEEVLERLGRTPLCHGLMLDLCLTAYWDGTVDQAERDELLSFGSKLGLTPEQVEAILAVAGDLVASRSHQGSLERAVAAGISREGLALAVALEEATL